VFWAASLPLGAVAIAADLYKYFRWFTELAGESGCHAFKYGNASLSRLSQRIFRSIKDDDNQPIPREDLAEYDKARGKDVAHIPHLKFAVSSNYF
jgi:hypothetical protein